MSRQFRWPLVIFWIVAGAAQAADEAPGKPLYSLEPGTRWSYDEVQTSEQVLGDRTNVTHVTGTIDEEVFQAPPQYKEKGEVVLVRSTSKQQRESNGAVSSESGGFVQLLEWRQGALYVHGIRVWVDGSYSEDMNLYQPPLLYLKSPARMDESWTVGTQKIMGIKMPTMATMDGTETVTVPAGTFSNCLKVTYVTWKMSGVTESPSGNLRVVDGNVRDTVWFAKGLGIVKEVQVSRAIYATNQGRAVNREEHTKALKSHTPVK